jgi:uncharacterized protein YjbI with pentapeptide repeats
MAKSEHVVEFLKGVKAWNSWRLANPEIKPDLSGVEIHNEHYQSINLSETNLQSTRFRFCLFTDADFSRADLRFAILRNSTATNARFDDAQLSHIGPQVNFAGSSFVGATLIGCDFAEESFFGADLSDATLEKCNLMRANLIRTQMKGTLLSSCGLHEAFLVQAVVEGAKFEKCVFSQTVVAGIDLSVVTGLETCQHDGPSHVAASLEATARGIQKRFDKLTSVEVFLRGAGVPDEYLATFRATVQKPFEFYSCFISYSHTDADFARRLYNDLQMTGIRCWLDEHALLPGDDIFSEVDKAIRSWDKLILCCSRASLDSWWVARELDTAFEKERNLHKAGKVDTLAIIPIDLDGFLFQWTGSHAASLKKRLAANFTGWQTNIRSYQKPLNLLASALRSAGWARPQPPESKLW